MLENTMRKYREELLREGEEAGLKRGEEAGLKKGLIHSIRLLVADCFGDEARSLDEWLDGVSCRAPTYFGVLPTVFDSVIEA